VLSASATIRCACPWAIPINGAVPDSGLALLLVQLLALFLLIAVPDLLICASGQFGLTGGSALSIRPPDLGAALAGREWNLPDDALRT